MRITYTTYSAPAWSIEEHIRVAKQMGCEGLEFRMLDDQPVEPNMPQDERRRIADLCAQAGLEICVVGSDCRFAIVDPAERREQVERATRFVELADEWGAPIVRVFGGRHSADLPADEVNRWVAEAVREVAAAADQYGIQVALETHDDFRAGARVARVLQAADHPGVGVVWDLGHPYRVGETVEQTWELIGRDVVHVHFKDIKQTGEGPEGWEPVLAGNGDLPLQEMVDRLAREGYDGFLSTEWERRVDPVEDDPARALPQHTAYLRELIARAHA